MRDSAVIFLPKCIWLSIVQVYTRTNEPKAKNKVSVFTFGPKALRPVRIGHHFWDGGHPLSFLSFFTNKSLVSHLRMIWAFLSVSNFISALM